jgi:DNA repair protein RadA/Sms
MRGHGGSGPAVPIGQVDIGSAAATSTGLAELDRVLSGGLVPGSVTLVGGEPGMGKSTLLLQVAASWAATGGSVLYVTAEESVEQVRLRGERLGAVVPGLWLAAATSMPEILEHIRRVRPALVILDSIQTVYDPELTSAPGSVVQVRECAHRLVAEAKTRGVAVCLVGHVTKDGQLAGPRVLEHVVDTVLAFEGDRHHALRLLRAAKHRFGSTSELGVLEMTENGLAAVPDASGLFLADRCRGVPGAVVAPTVDGNRPLLVELQALVTKSVLPVARRWAQGLDQGRLSLLLAVLEERAGIEFSNADVYALAVGGVRVVEPGADLAVALAAASAKTDTAIPSEVVACAEVGLGGELRQVGQTARRLAEAARFGFTRAVLPARGPDPPRGMSAVRAESLVDALRAVAIEPARRDAA